MNLLPKSHTEFSSKDYWDRFFKKRGHRAFEWYGEYPQLCEYLFKYLRIKDRFLVIGCGNSSLSADLYDSGYSDSVSIDISDVVIQQMSKKYGSNRPGLVFQKMDMLETTFKDGEFGVVLDKGTLDALMSDDVEETQQTAEKMFSEISRLLRLGGRYICISLLQQHILKKILQWFTKEGWLIRIQRCFEAEEGAENRENSLVFPVFMVICTKLQKLTGVATVLELSLNKEAKFQRSTSIEECLDSIQSVQHFAMLKHNLNTRNFLGEVISIQLFAPASSHPRYTLFVVDCIHGQSGKKFAIFITPQGRETEWMFAVPEGQQQLAKNAQFQRLVIVHLNRNHVYGGMEEIKAELSGEVMAFAPKGLKQASDVPFLSVGDDVGKRDVCYRGSSSFSGDFIVEDVLSNNELFRRLIFLSNQMIIQSEAKLKLVSAGRKKKGMKTVVDHSYLACTHHAYMIAGLAFIAPKAIEEEANALLIGLGGGSLAMYIANYLQKVNLVAVDIDHTITDVARQWFGLKTSEKLKVNVEDGLNTIQEAVKKGLHYDAILLDVDSKDSSVGMTCPPAAFVTKEVLQNLASIVQPSGMVILNLVCRDETLKCSVYEAITGVFPRSFKVSIPDEVNEVVFALSTEEHAKSSTDAVSVSEKLHAQVTKLAKQIKSQTRSDIVNVTDMMKNLEVVVSGAENR